jgi:hypothetical protein
LDGVEYNEMTSTVTVTVLIEERSSFRPLIVRLLENDKAELSYEEGKIVASYHDRQKARKMTARLDLLKAIWTPQLSEEK